MAEEETVLGPSKAVRIGGYLIAAGALVGFSLGVYLLFSRDIFSDLFSYFIRIAQFEVMSYFLGVFIPSFAILIVVGYLFATTLRMKKAELSNVVPLCVLSLLCLVFSAASVFYFISFFGGCLVLAALIRTYTKATLKTLSKREAFFFVEIGALLIASFSVLFLLMWFISNVFQTYAMGFLNYSPHALLLVGIFSFVMFFVIPFWGSRGTNAGLCGALGLMMTILTYLFVVQNQYALFNASAYIGIFMLVLGFASALIGDLLYLRLFFSQPSTPATAIIGSELLYQGGYCPYCGKPRLTASQKLCSDCGRSLMWTPYAPFCSSCGRLAPTNTMLCPHCKENIQNKRVFFQLREATEQGIASKVITKSSRKQSWMSKRFAGLVHILQIGGKAIWSVTRVIDAVIDRLSLTFKETVFILILTCVFGFISFIGYVNVEPSQRMGKALLILNYGFPLSWLKVHWWPKPMFYIDAVYVVWIFLIVDLILYFLASLTIVYGLVRLRRST